MNTAVLTPKLDARRQHVIDRARERYGLRLTEADIATMEAQCRTGKATLVSRNPDGSERRLAMAGGRALLVVWRPLRSFIVTVAPRHLDNMAAAIGRWRSRDRKGRARRSHALEDAEARDRRRRRGEEDE